MNMPDSISAAQDQLNRTLGFFSRVDSKASVVFGVDTALLGVLTTRTFPYADLRWEWAPVVLTIVLLAISYWHLYREAFPALEGGQDSMLYFREISKRTEARYVTAWKEMTEDEYLNDLLGQVWRNSQILKQKFNHVKWAFNTLALAIVPWIVSLAALTLRVSAQ